MLKYVSQFFLQIFPSVVATVVGAYIVNHYVIPKSGSDAPKTAAYSKATPGADDDQGAIDVTPKPDAAATQDSKSEAKGEAKAKPAEAAKTEPKSEAKTETSKGEPKRSAAREKPAIRVVLPGSAETAAAPSAAAPSAPTPPVASTAPDEHRDRDANELARAAIERLRNTGSAETPRVETPRVQDAAREIPREPAVREPVRVNVVAVPPVQPRAPVQPLPPPVNVMAPSADNAVDPLMQTPPYAPPPRVVDANRLVPPADIPTGSRPLDLQAAAAKTSVADDMLSAARSVIHTIVPQ
jgi:hypothetical protein